MKSLARLLLLLSLAALAAMVFGQMGGRKHAWSGKADSQVVRAGESMGIMLTATIDSGWAMYKLGQEGGPQGTEITLAEGTVLEPEDAPIGPDPKTKNDPNFGGIEVGYHEGQVEFLLPVRVKKGTAPGEYKATVNIISQVCDKTSCDRPREDAVQISFTVEEGPAREEFISQANRELDSAPPKPDSGSGGSVNEFGDDVAKAKEGGVGAFFLFGFVAGLLALLTPCVFPMIPVTVSFFTKESEKGGRKGVLRSALLYCIGIVTTFTAIGIVVTLVFGATGVQSLATNPWVNAALFLLFVFLAASLFGVVELALPASWTTALSSKSRTAGFAAPILLGLTFSLTSFTCTVPIVGTILASAAAGGGLLYPIVGMVAFSTALAIPFFLLALFPELLKKLPKSGQWMVTVKAFMGFLELLAALKFLSNIDLVFQWELISRPVFLAIWATILAVCGLYLLGWVRLPHDDAVKIGWFRRVFALLSLGAAIACLGGIQGMRLGTVDAFLPPANYALPKPATAGESNVNQEEGWWLDLELAKAEAAKTGKPLFIDFTGYT